MSIRRCHNSIARAMYYTSVTVVLGFSILALSNFIPTIYFGVLSGLAMITALSRQSDVAATADRAFSVELNRLHG